MQCCTKYPSIDIPDQETDDQYPDTSPAISFRIYHIIARCKKRGRIPLTAKKKFRKCQHDTASVQSIKVYTRKELLMMETTISDFILVFLYCRNLEVGVSHDTRTNTGYKSMW